MVRRAALILALVGTAAADCPASQPDCDAGDEAVLLQSRLHRSVPAAALQREVVSCCSTCKTTCSGNQCCPGIERTDGRTYPCPNAEPHWNECQTFGPRGAAIYPPKLPPTPALKPEQPPETPPKLPPKPDMTPELPLKPELPPESSIVHTCDCNCTWLAHGEDDCRQDMCADRCRVANGMRKPTTCKNGQVWEPRRNFRPSHVFADGRLKCDCQWMAGSDGLGDSCAFGCDPDDCAHKCREANPMGTCWSASAVAAPPATTTTSKPDVVHACGCDCSWVAHGKDNCRKDTCADRCRVANGILGPLHCDLEAPLTPIDWTPNRNLHPSDVWEEGNKRCSCGWMASDGGLGDSCTGGCSPDDCAFKCRQANPLGTCLSA